MNPERWQQVDSLFAAALERPAAERLSFIRDNVNGDEELRREVESLLASDDSGFLAGDAAEDVSRLLVHSEAKKLIGRTVGRFEILAPIGSGGMAEVFRGRDVELNRPVALKLISSHLAADPERVRRFRAEALAASALNHPNIITVYEIAELEGRAVIITEFVDGETLRERLHRGPLKIAEAAAIAIQVADALDAAHRAGIVHRDVKPENIMIRADGRVKVLDFGIAKQQAIDASVAGTRPGEVIGTVGYMSPEQARGLAVDARTDLWSLGVVLYEAVTGQLPFPGDTATDRLAAIVTREPASLGRAVPLELEPIVRRALSKDREQRYASASEMIVDLQQLRSGGTVRRRNWLVPAAIAILILVIVAVLVRNRDAGPGTRNQITTPAAPEIDSVAVLPFTVTGGDEDTEVLSDGITDSLISSFSQLPDVRVMSRHSIFRYKGRDADARQVGNELDVQAVVSGRVVHRGNDLMVSVEVIDARDNRQIWGRQYRSARADILDLQEEISRDIVNKLRVRLTPEQKVRVEKQHTNDADAYLLYLKGRYYWYKSFQADYHKAVEFFERAIEKDPNYSLAHVGIADFYGFGASMGRFPPEPAWQKAEAAAARAQQHDPDTAELQNTIAGRKVAYRDWTGAEKEFRRGIELNPNYAEIYNNYSSFLGLMGRFDEAIAVKRRAVTLDPLSVRPNAFLGELLYFGGRYDDAIDQLHKTLEIDPADRLTRERLAQSYGAKGQLRESVAEWAQVVALPELPRIFDARGYDEAIRLVGQRRVAQLESRRSRGDYIAPMHWVVPYVQAGELDSALEWLDRASLERTRLVLFAGIDPALDPLRSKPRFQSILARLKLERLRR